MGEKWGEIGYFTVFNLKVLMIKIRIHYIVYRANFQFMVIYGGKTCKDGVKVGKNRVILNFMTYGCVIAHFDIINE